MKRRTRSDVLGEAGANLALSRMLRVTGLIKDECPLGMELLLVVPQSGVASPCPRRGANSHSADFFLHFFFGPLSTLQGKDRPPIPEEG